MNYVWKGSLVFVKWDKFDSINQLITLYMIPLTCTHCNNVLLDAQWQTVVTVDIYW